jgi:hypothetical protein
MKQTRSPEITYAQTLLLLISALLFFAAVFWPSGASAQVAPGVFTTLKATSSSATALCVGCPTGTSTPAANSGGIFATITLPSGVPSSTVNKLYSSGGALFFNGLSLATGSSISGTTGTLPKFTAPTVLGDSIVSESGGTITVAGLVQSNGNVTSGTNGSEGNFILNGPAGSNRIVAWRTAGVNRWFAYATSVAETGSNAGSNWRLDAYNDAGTIIGSAIFVTRSTMAIVLGQNLTVTGTSALSGGATAGVSFQLTGAAPVYLANVNNGYLFRNAADGATLFSITNAGVTRIGNNTTTAGFGVNAAGDWTFGASSHVQDSTGTPTKSAGADFGTGAVTGLDYAIVITYGANSTTGGSVVFGHGTFTTAPVCVPLIDSNITNAKLTNVTVTGFDIVNDSGTYNGFKISVLCRGF